MSDTTKSPVPGAAAEGPKFTERELQLLGWAMQSLKSGPPEIDNEKLAAFAGMSNPRSASNAWANIKKKLMMPSDGSAPPTPKKAAGRKKKDEAGEDGEDTPKKTHRKRANQEPEDGDASPKKKGRPARPKPKQEPEEETCK
ncbi:hypothetical protein BU25DRAFT_469914 [Macroventuria anomochaeta]|uniref:Uncharacterized protein n=1 Tax=Macroventuria anomochaeta TaxID=301207 RepID=A0ACB6RYQ7_9PLEO|nr:uncharacterized protein BU25DRAFT_469914 [Macroventuria anomochaeta]KAF2626852.1 hypothetical protein BU25DRAFT_469914 [Macroventuria anomochaeta]